MSHFTVLVVGDPDKLDEHLAPYSEHLEGEPRVDETAAQILDNLLRNYQEYENYGSSEFIDQFFDDHPDYKTLVDELRSGGVEHVLKNFRRLYDNYVRDWYSEEADENGNTITTYNTDSKWDWYVVGGRWTGYFKVKPEFLNDPRVQLGESGAFGNKPYEHTADVLPVEAIDIEGMQRVRVEQAKNTWLIIEEARANNGVATVIKQFYDPTYPNNLREETQTTEIHPMFDLGLTQEEFDTITREELVENARNSAISTFAVLKDGVWYERGSMGWWGIVSDEKDRGEWDREFTKMLESLPAGTMVSLVDCHI